MIERAHRLTETTSRNPEMQALFVSGYAEVPVAQQLIAEGAVLLQKPVSRIDLLRKVDEILHSKVSNV